MKRVENRATSSVEIKTKLQIIITRFISENWPQFFAEEKFDGAGFVLMFLAKKLTEIVFEDLSFVDRTKSSQS